MLITNRAIRWTLLMLGLFAVIALTGMNVYSLYDIRDRVAESETERQIKKVDEITQKVWNVLYQPFRSLTKLDLEPIETSLNRTGTFPSNIEETLKDIAGNKLFTSIYYTPEAADPCVDNTPVYTYNTRTFEMEQTQTYSSLLCNGVGLIRTKARIQVNDFNYRFNNIVEFDTHRSMNIGLLNLTENRVIGYFTFIINKEYVVNDLIASLVTDYFEPSSKSGNVVWLHDWVKNEVLVSSDPSIDFDYDLVDHRKRFRGDMFDNWNLKVAFLTPPITTAYQNSFVKNLIVLGCAVLFLLGALLFMFYTAQKERNLSQRQAGFLANVTHELKTPLAVMQAAGENIYDGRVTEEKRLKQYGKHIYEESIRLRSMIEKLLDVAKYDSGHSPIETAPYILHKIIGNYVDQNRGYIESQGFTLSFSFEAQCPAVQVDKSSIETIISNLTENAIKYSTDTKKISISVFQKNEHVVLQVEDKGMGIEKKELKNIFKKFYRVEDSLVARTKGHGLGLSIVLSLVELNGGSIHIESEYGKGSTFSVSFPVLGKQEIKLKSQKNGVLSAKQIKERTIHA